MRGLAVLLAALLLPRTGDAAPAATGAAPAALPANADAVLACMRANVPQSLQIRDVELTTTDRAGKDRVLKGKVYASRSDGRIRALLRVSRPSDLDGAAYLMREGVDGGRDELFLYLPALQRVRKITGASIDASLLGTDFSYNDMKQLQAAFGDARATLAASSRIGSRPVHVVDLAAAPAPAGAPARITSVRLHVDREACVALKAEFRAGDVVAKELLAAPEHLRQADGYWYLSDLTMRDLRERTQTRLRITGVSGGDDALPGRLFDPTSFYRGN